MSRVTQRLKAPGVVCGFSGLVALASAWFTGNALAFVIGYTLLFGLAFHWVVARFCIANLEIELHPLARRARAYAPIPFEAKLRNRSAWLPIRCPTIKAIETGKNRELNLLFPQTFSPGQSANLTLYPQFGRRGTQHLLLVEASSYFPFGFTRSSKAFSIVSNPVQIWPESTRIPAGLFRNLERHRESDLVTVRQTRPVRADPDRFREYQSGDSKRRINWKLSAKSRKLIVVENPNGPQAFIWFIINTHPSGWRRPVDFENGLRLISSALEKSLGRRMLAGAIINNEPIPIRSHADLENALDRLSGLSMDLDANSKIPILRKGEVLICSDRKGVVLRDWTKERVSV